MCLTSQRSFFIGHDLDRPRMLAELSESIAHAVNSVLFIERTGRMSRQLCIATRSHND